MVLSGLVVKSDLHSLDLAHDKLLPLQRKSVSVVATVPPAAAIAVIVPPSVAIVVPAPIPVVVPPGKGGEGRSVSAPHGQAAKESAHVQLAEQAAASSESCPPPS